MSKPIKAIANILYSDGILKIFCKFSLVFSDTLLTCSTIPDIKFLPF